MDLEIAKPLSLKCGLTLPNRIIKAAMAEALADKEHMPNAPIERIYKHWAKGGWGMVLTSNVFVNLQHNGSPNDIAVDPSKGTELQKVFARWATICKEGGSPAVVQLNHPGRQSPIGAGNRGFFAKTLAPSPIKLNLGPGLIAKAVSTIVFGTPAEMTKEDIKTVIEEFAYAARLCADSGFDGVELHGAHGYLLAQFMSPDSNKRTDEYGGSARNRVRIVEEILEAVHDVVPKSFCVGMKLNSVDHQSKDLADCIEQLKLIVKAGVDFLEISGGSYEDPLMVGAIQDDHPPKRETTKKREAFFLDFAEAIRHEFPGTPLMVTGGLRSRSAMESAVKSGGCDLVGLARPACLNPAVPKDIILNEKVSDEDARIHMKTFTTPAITKLIGLKAAVGAGAENMYYMKQMHQIGKEPSEKL